MDSIDVVGRNGEILTCQECGQPRGKIVDSFIGLLILCKKCFFELTDEGEDDKDPPHNIDCSVCGEEVDDDDQVFDDVELGTIHYTCMDDSGLA